MWTQVRDRAWSAQCTGKHGASGDSEDMWENFECPSKKGAVFSVLDDLSGVAQGNHSLTLYK